jgi:hypothetical protein
MGYQYLVVWVACTLWYGLPVPCGMGYQYLVVWVACTLWYGLPVLCGMGYQYLVVWDTSTLWYVLLVLCVLFFLSQFCCLSFFDLRLLITFLVSSMFIYYKVKIYLPQSIDNTYHKVLLAHTTTYW